MKYLCQNKYWEINKEYNIDKLLYLMIDRPKYINKYNDFIWTNKKNQRHRDYDLPSNIHYYSKTCVDVFWYLNNIKHRKNKKFVHIDYRGYKDYYINGKYIKSEQSK